MNDTTLTSRDLSAFQRNILVILAEGPQYGLGIKEDLEAYYSEEVNHGRLYPNLDKLVNAGYIEKSQRDRRTNEYALTDAGFEAILEHLSWTFDSLTSNDKRTEQLQAACEEWLEQ